MLVTPIEALELYSFLEGQDRLNDELWSRLDDNIRTYRLDVEFLLGRGRELRKYYTCPFFNEGPKGCSIAPEYKPYGCLGFNPKIQGVCAEGQCGVNEKAHLEREEQCKEREDAVNSEMKQQLGLYWDKKPIPVALRELRKILNTKN